MKNEIKVALLTAGLKPENFERAATRVVRDSTELFNFSEIFVLGVDNLKSYCPQTFQKYGDFLNPNVRGFGYWAWKSEFVFRVLSGELGHFDQVVWIDSGCEINANHVSKFIFQKRISMTKQSGSWFHALNSSDYQYTKGFVLQQFPELSVNQINAPQIQANYFHLSKDSSLELTREWYEVTSRSIQNVDLNQDLMENIGFMEHRSDQSILSLVAKKHGAVFKRLNLPSGNTSKSAARAAFEPIWISRNREGESIIPSIISWIP
jgi:hypothetical protein